MTAYELAILAAEAAVQESTALSRGRAAWAVIQKEEAGVGGLTRILAATLLDECWDPIELRRRAWQRAYNEERSRREAGKE